MATIGQALTAPESGWKRINADHPLLSYKGSWTTQTNSAYSGGINKYTMTPSDSISFTFRGTKLRYIGQYNTTSKTPISISIDGVTEQINFLSNTLINSVLVYEKTGLVEDIHTVVVTFNATNEYQSLQGIDIDSSGRMLHPDEVTDIKDLAIGKRIRCNYSAISGFSGTFSGLGEETADFIPISSSANPSGDFYFIMVEDFNKKKILIADRNVQHSISWDTLNSSGVVSGVKMPTKPFKGSLSGYENDEVQVSDNGFISGANGDYVGWKAFDGKNGMGDKWANTVSVSKPAELTVRFKKRKPKINAFTITPPPPASAGSADHPKHFKLQASDDGSSWVDLFEHTTGIGASRTRFAFNNQHAYSYYRFTVLSTNGGSQVQIGEIEFEGASELSNADTTIRLLTGGTMAGDTDNEWDKYIVSSTLNGKITAGENAVWNWSNNIWSWTSTTRRLTDYPATHRVVRGQASAVGLGSNTSNLAINGAFVYGFRPILEIKMILRIKSLILSGGEYKKFNPGKVSNPDIVQDVIPTMTSNTTPSGLAFASSIYSATFDAWYAFNKKDDNEGWAMRTGSTSYIGYGFTTPKRIIKYAIRSGNIPAELPKSWTLSGSNDSTNGADGTWTVIDRQTGQTWTTIYTEIEYTVQSPGVYKFYRLDISENNGNASYIGLNELKMYEIVTPASPAIPSSWETVSTTLPDSDTFIDKGMDLSVFDRKLITIEIAMNDNSASGEVLGKGRMFKERIDLNKYIDIKKINVK